MSPPPEPLTGAPFCVPIMIPEALIAVGRNERATAFQRGSPGTTG